MPRKMLPGHPFPLGASWDGLGANFAIFSENATQVELCLFDHPDDPKESECIRLTEMTGHVWHAYVPGIQPGQLYGYRIDGPYQPEAGLRFNRNKLLIDPYAKALHGEVNWDANLFSYQLGDQHLDLSFSEDDDAWGVPKSVVINPYFSWEDDRPPRTPWHESIIYEVHVKGFSIQNPSVPPSQRGTYAGLGSPGAVEYFRSLGITAVELMPVHAFLDDKHLIDQGLHNYWGYNTVNFFSPDARYSSVGDIGGQVQEFKSMVKSLHRAGIEVILDVVYNHTAEGNELGPTLSFKGIDNPAYYRLVPGNERYYMDYTGTGNSLNVRNPQVLKLIMDSLRYWVTEMHVDGFRFDLAAALARELHDVDRLSAFFDIIHQDPIISRVKLIAEPWDVGEGGYQVGNFPTLWTEWNGKYRDTLRKYWRGDESQLAELGYRLTGSSDLYQHDGRRPYASINFVTAHDGFTLNDLVSYNEKHNEANGENNNDGANDNWSYNYGVEGPTDDPGVRAVRERQKRNFIATLLISQGVPMLCGGDEIGRTQDGNNNAYCQDNAISWYNWNLTDDERALWDFTRQMIALRKSHPMLRRRRFFRGRPIRGHETRDITWFTPDGKEMTAEEWDTTWMRCIGMRLAGEATGEVDEVGEPVTDDTLLVLLNAADEVVPFTLPDAHFGEAWQVLVDTRSGPKEGGNVVSYGEVFQLEPRSLALMRWNLPITEPGFPGLSFRRLPG